MSYVELPLLLALPLALLLTWKDVNARWLIFTLCALQAIDMIAFPIVINWTQHYYIWCVLLNLVFIIVVIGRKQWANILFEKTRVKFFNQVIQNYNFTVAECAFLVMYSASIIVNLITWGEVQLYAHKIISTPLFYSYIYTPAQIVIHTLESLAVITFVANQLRMMTNRETV
ncbi:hypothetical protein [Pseudoalteromonas rubra]|uniref:hypothetical protein n=1 Tax=Pseudoalteromonas rubra TaxID=43658 RepID=UPI000F777A08|nr:hypothetical protein [Pseudoalteromonas rubra]